MFEIGSRVRNRHTGRQGVIRRYEMAASKMACVTDDAGDEWWCAAYDLDAI